MFVAVLALAVVVSGAPEPAPGLEGPGERPTEAPERQAPGKEPEIPPGLTGHEQSPTGERAQEAEPRAGWDPDLGGFFVRSDDGAYRLQIGMNAAYRFEPAWLDGAPQPRSDFTVLRPFIGGNVFRKWIRFWTSLELADNPPFPSIRISRPSRSMRLG